MLNAHLIYYPCKFWSSDSSGHPHEAEFFSCTLILVLCGVRRKTASLSPHHSTLCVGDILCSQLITSSHIIVTLFWSGEVVPASVDQNRFKEKVQYNLLVPSTKLPGLARIISSIIANLGHFVAWWPLRSKGRSKPTPWRQSSSTPLPTTVDAVFLWSSPTSWSQNTYI